MRFHNSFVIFFSILGCFASKPGDANLDRYQEHFPILKKWTWTVYSVDLNDEKVATSIELVRTDGDTTIVADASQGFDLHDPSKMIWDLEFVKSFTRTDTLHYINFDEKNSLKYHYKVAPKSDGKFIFIVGKYYHDYLFGDLDNRQRVFFESHKDSLIRIRGDKLPGLPR